MIEEVETFAAPSGKSVIHVLDSEGDDYRLFSRAVEKHRRFVLRAAFDRALARNTTNGISTTTREFVSKALVAAKRNVTLAKRRRRPGDKRKRTEVREQREAELAIRAAPVVFKRPSTCAAAENLPAEVSVNIVMVSEVNAPADVEPIEWVLVTTEAISTHEQILKVVDAYRGRWVIEEYFKALKTGCSIEKRQAESWEAMQNVLALLAPIAWNLLRLRTLSRTNPEAPATAVLTHSQIEVLRNVSEKELPLNATVRDVLLSVARLGGHLRSNGDPGWFVLGRGYERLLLLEQGYRVGAKRSDR